MLSGYDYRIRKCANTGGYQIRLTQLPFGQVQAGTALFLHHGVHLKTNRQVWGHEYLYKTVQANLVKLIANAAVYKICQSFVIEHAHIVSVLEALDFLLCHVMCHSIVPNICCVVQPLNGLKCVAHREQVNLRAHCNKLDDLITLN